MEISSKYMLFSGEDRDVITKIYQKRILITGTGV